MTRKVQGKEEQKTDEVQYAVLKAHDNAGYSSIAQSVEHAAVNRGVVGSSPTGGAKSLRNRMIMRFLFSLTRFLHDFIQDLHCALLFAGIKMGIGIPCHLNIGMA